MPEPSAPIGFQAREVLVHEALVGRNRLPAIETILDRLEGKSRQRVEIDDVTAELRNKSDAELQFHLDNNRWPDEEELQLLQSTQKTAWDNEVAKFTRSKRNPKTYIPQHEHPDGVLIIA
jgi:hypothetical protein